MRAGIKSKVHGPGLEPAIGFAIACALMAGCDAQATDRYDGESLLTVRGRVELSLQRDDEAELLPALAFQTDDEGKFRLIDVHTQGAFPAAFTLSVLEPPPEKAIRPLGYLSEQPRAAVGYITAVTPDLPREFAYDFPRSYMTQTVFDEDGMRWDCNAEIGFCYFDEEYMQDGLLRVRRTTCPSIDAPREQCSESNPLELADPYRHFAGLSENYIVLYLPEPAAARSAITSAIGIRDRELGDGYHLIATRHQTDEERAANDQCRTDAAALAVERYNEEQGTDFTVEDLFIPCSSSGPCVRLDDAARFDLLEELAHFELGCRFGDLVADPVEDPANEHITVRIGPELAL